MNWIYALLTGVVFVVLSFFFWFHKAKSNPDPTVGGAYSAMFMLTSPIVFIVGFLLYWIFTWIRS